MLFRGYLRLRLRPESGSGIPTLAYGQDHCGELLKMMALENLEMDRNVMFFGKAGQENLHDLLSLSPKP